jgi:hypothetical protein
MASPRACRQGGCGRLYIRLFVERGVRRALSGWAALPVASVVDRTRRWPDMGSISELAGPLERLITWRRDQRKARAVTKSHVAQMQREVDVALQHERWPPGATTAPWTEEWSTNGPLLAGKMRSDSFAALDEVYRLAADFERGLGPGERPFDATAQTAGDDRRFFERYRAALERADRALDGR